MTAAALRQQNVSSQFLLVASRRSDSEVKTENMLMEEEGHRISYTSLQVASLYITGFKALFRRNEEDGVDYPKGIPNISLLKEAGSIKSAGIDTDSD